MKGRPSHDTERPLSIGILSLSAIPDDPRVRRQGDLFASRGWAVRAFGLPGARSGAPNWACAALMSASADPVSAEAGAMGAQGHAMPGATAARGRSIRRARRLLNVVQAKLVPQHAAAGYWALDSRFSGLLDLGRDAVVDVWLANDWSVLPIARQLASEQGVPYVYDAHELAIDEYAHRWRWRLFQRPLVVSVERAGLPEAALVSCVSQGIADRMKAFYALPQSPLVIRNVPFYTASPFRPCGETIEVLYHGVVSPDRGLEACIDSVALWRPEFRLTIRGPGSEAYLATLERRIESAGLTGRIVLAPPVPMVDLVREATHFDIGLFALPGHSQQNVHVLPNKFFEYAMAGLAICVSDLPEMTALLRQHDLGRLIPEVTPQAIAAAINGFDRNAVNACKSRALEAAKVLNWEVEADRFFVAIERTVRAAKAAPRHAAR